MNQCFSEGCQGAVVYSFTWGWGAAGACCAEHRVNAQQVHDAQGRGQIAFQDVDPNRPPPPMGRDERTLLIAAKLSAEEECVQLKAESARLFNANTELQAEVRRLRARDTASVQQLQTRDEQIEHLKRTRDETLAELHEAQQENRRLALLIPRDEPPPSLSLRGGAPTTPPGGGAGPG